MLDDVIHLVLSCDDAHATIEAIFTTPSGALREVGGQFSAATPIGEVIQRLREVALTTIDTYPDDAGTAATH